MKEIFYILGFLVGCTVGYSFLPNIIGPKRTVTVTITRDFCSFKSNYIRDGDEFYIILNGDTLDSGVAKNRQWVEKP